MPVSPAWCRPHHFLALGDVNLRTEAEHDINMVAAMESRSSSPSLVGLQPGSHACGFSSKQQSRNDHSSWLVEEWQSLLEHVGLLLCSILSLGGGENLEEMASIRGISTDICVYLSFGHGWTNTSTHWKVDLLVAWVHCDSGIPCPLFELPSVF